MRMGTVVFLILLVTASGLQPGPAISQTENTVVDQALYQEIAHMDSIFFEAFNNRDLEKIKTMFSRDLEFYHDTGGLGDYEQNIKASEDLFKRNNGLTRTLVEGSLEVYPVKDYGAIQIGSHTFCHMENGQEDCGTFKFVHLWRKENDSWKLTRVISYGH